MDSDKTDRLVFQIVQREILLLALLIAITIPLFLFTRSVAARNRAANVQIANMWYQIAQKHLKSSDTKQAIEALRKASTNDHDNPAYALALASALAADGHTEEAQQGLLRLRMAAPEDGEINLSLARLAAADGMMDEAIRYYHNALYGSWSADQMSPQRIAMRTELVRFLLRSGARSRALSELLLLSSDIPDKDQAHSDLGHLFLQAGDSAHALDQFRRALELNAKNAEAAAGAGQAAFNLTDYTSARQFFDAAVAGGATAGPISELLDTATLVVDRNPLAPRLRTSERIRRLSENLEFASNRLDSCVNSNSLDPAAQVLLQPLREELDRKVHEELRPVDLKADAEGLRTGMNLIYRIESATGQVCQGSSNLDRALLLIARKQGVAEQ